MPTSKLDNGKYIFEVALENGAPAELVNKLRGLADTAIPSGTRVTVETLGDGIYEGFEKKTFGTNKHHIRFDSGGVQVVELGALQPKQWSVAGWPITSVTIDPPLEPGGGGYYTVRNRSLVVSTTTVDQNQKDWLASETELKQVSSDLPLEDKRNAFLSPVGVLVRDGLSVNANPTRTLLREEGVVKVLEEASSDGHLRGRISDSEWVTIQAVVGQLVGSKTYTHLEKVPDESLATIREAGDKEVVWMQQRVNKTIQALAASMTSSNAISKPADMTDIAETIQAQQLQGCSADILIDALGKGNVSIASRWPQTDEPDARYTSCTWWNPELSPVDSVSNLAVMLDALDALAQLCYWSRVDNNLDDVTTTTSTHKVGLPQRLLVSTLTCVTS